MNIFPMNRPIEAELFNFQCEYGILMELAKEVISQLHIEHLNPEEHINLQCICATYAMCFILRENP